ncbi:MAG: glutamate--cysteine ligase, partial [Acidimicrobiia bacterium]
EKGTSAPVVKVLEVLVEELSPVDKRLGCAAELAEVRGILDHQPSAVRQRRLVAQGASLGDVVDSLVTELRTDRPTVV